MSDFIWLFFDILKASFTVFLFVLVYFAGLETFRRYKCKLGLHSGHIKDGKLVCHTCFKEID